MFARITHYKMKKSSIEAATALIEELKPQIMAMPGMHQFLNTMNDDGSGCVISVNESREIADKNAEKTAALWGTFADHLESQPKPEGFDVIGNWSA